MVVVRWMEGRRGAVARLCCSERRAWMPHSPSRRYLYSLSLSLSQPRSLSFKREKTNAQFFCFLIMGVN